jgi:hypothetical protein
VISGKVGFRSVIAGALAIAGIGAGLGTTVASAHSRSISPHAIRSAVKISAGRLAPSGTALVTGRLPKSISGKPKSFVLSKNSADGSGDVVLGSASEKAPKGTYRSWVSLPDIIATGSWHLLACGKATPSSSSCASVGAVHVGNAPAPVVATPKLETSHASSDIFSGNNTKMTATAADGTTFTLSVPASDLAFPVTMTPVSSLSPASAVGSLTDGVVIGPAGDAPAGATLVIKPKKQPPKTARIVGFGIDPSGAAYSLPIAFGKTAKIPVQELGGYGIAVPTSSANHAKPACAPAPHLVMRPAASGSRPLTSCSSAAQRIQQLADALRPSIGKARQDALLGVDQGNALTHEITGGMVAATAAIESEAAQVFNQPSSDEGAAELQTLATTAMGLARQQELLGVDSSAMGNLLNRIISYETNNLVAYCTDKSTTRPAAALLAHAFQVFGFDRQLGLIGGENLIAKAEQAATACVERVNIQLKATDSSDFSDIELDLKAAVAANNVMIQGEADPSSVFGASLQGADATLTYISSSVTVQPLYAQAGETGTFVATTGTVHPGTVGFDATTHIRCDQNRQFVVDYTANLRLRSEDLWQDIQKLQTAFNGTVIGTTRTGSVEAGAWAEDVNSGKIPAFFQVPIDPSKPTELADSGPCFGSECVSFSYDATFTATGQDG